MYERELFEGVRVSPDEFKWFSYEIIELFTSISHSFERERSARLVRCFHETHCRSHAEPSRVHFFSAGLWFFEYILWNIWIDHHMLLLNIAHFRVKTVSHIDFEPAEVNENFLWLSYVDVFWWDLTSMFGGFTIETWFISVIFRHKVAMDGVRSDFQQKIFQHFSFMKRERENVWAQLAETLKLSPIWHFLLIFSTFLKSSLRVGDKI